MAETEMRVVPSGKIYRQMFEAQVQLNRSLTKVTRETTSIKTTRGGTAVPIVHLSKGDIDHGLLGERQRTWADSFPNDPYVENPVVYKQYAEFVGSQMKEPDSTLEGREVRGLPDVVAPAKESSNIIERIAASRKDRHEATVEEMHQELSVVNSEMEPRIAELCENLLQNLNGDDTVIASVFARFETDEDLLTYPLDGLHRLWEEIQSHSQFRQEWIVDLDNALKKAEDDRMDMIKSIFKDYAKTLEKIAHILAPDLHRFMDKESQLINQTVLSNRRAYGDLFVRLMSMDIEREKAQHTKWKRRVEDWKMLKTELAIERFKTFMHDVKIVSPPGIDKQLQFMVSEQELLNNKRLELINQLRDLMPPSSTKTSVYHWNRGIQDVTQEIDTANQRHLAALHKEYERVCQVCLDEVEAIKRELIETGVCSDGRVKTVVEEFMLPLVGDRQRIYELNLETMEKSLEEVNKVTVEQLKALFKYAQAAAHVWDVHEIGLAKQERALQEKLEVCRQQHDNQNQDKEAHLDIIMDRMRQDATEKALKDSLTKALDMLEKIRHAYEVFHKDQNVIVKQYPDMVRGELKNYDEAMCRLFSVDRNNPCDQESERSTADSPDNDPVDGDVQPNKVKHPSRVSFDLLNNAEESQQACAPVLPEPDKEDTPLIDDTADTAETKQDKQYKDDATSTESGTEITAQDSAAVSDDIDTLKGKEEDTDPMQKEPDLPMEEDESMKNQTDEMKMELAKMGDGDEDKDAEEEVEITGEKGGDIQGLSADAEDGGEIQGISTDAEGREIQGISTDAEGREIQGISTDAEDGIPSVGTQQAPGGGSRGGSAVSISYKQEKEINQLDISVAMDDQSVVARHPKQSAVENQLQQSEVENFQQSEVGNELRQSEDRNQSRLSEGGNQSRLSENGNQSRLSESRPSSKKRADSTGKKKKTPTPKPYQKKEAKDLPSAVSEILSTKKGTTFYVLAVAGEYGISEESGAEKGPAKDQARDGGPAFMTEVSGMSGGEDGSPEYVRSVVIQDSLLIEIRKTIRLNFLNHLEEWTEQASERAGSVVVAKCEELNSELDLRLHLHKPRARRAEYDVHNVRAAELVMHSERVTRHCKGITQALTEVRSRFTNMTTEHNNLAAKFRLDIEALEVVFINATKASRLYGLKNQLNLELEKFMSVIRASLRQFRQHLDETLQMLRESNARFIKSFRVFSDGGNFCPEEIDEYRKRLDKMANSIDRSEGSVMSDLEDMESKRLEQATKIALEFEDRFKSHMFDLIFMEKIARWLTNTQVKIKAEVANSNTQAQKLGQHLLDIDRRVDACERPNLDKEQITSQQLNESLKGVFEAFKVRSEYLHCLKDPVMRPPSATMQGAPAVGVRVGFVQDTGPTPISKAGKQPSEDPSVGVIKGIMKSNKARLRFGADADLDGEYAPSPDPRDKVKSSMSTNASSDRGKLSRHGPSPGLASTNDGNTRKLQSAATRRSSKPAKYEKRTVIFGETVVEDEEQATHFLGIIRNTLKEALDGLLTASEMYYRQKGSRAVTRPQALQETFDLCADVIIQKLQSYYQQADDYHNQCLQEFRSQLSQLEKSSSHIPALIVSDLIMEHIKQAQNAHMQHEATFDTTQQQLLNKQKEHKHLLRPNLGHPHKVNELAELTQTETDRHTEYKAAVEKHAQTLQESAMSHSKTFLESLARMSENKLLQFDNMLVIDDVEKGRVEAKKYPTSELLRRKNAGEPLEDDEDKDALPRGKNTWSGVPSNELVTGEKPAKAQLTASVTTCKTTLGHSATVSARDHAYQDYKRKFEARLQEIEDEKQKLLLAEQRWMDSWNTSVEKVKELY